MTLIRSIGALLLGGLVGVVVYLAGAIIAFVSMHGIPLGSPGGAATRADLAVNLAGAIIASALAGTVAARLAPHRPLAHALALALGFAVLALWGFSKPASQWPSGYPMALALVGAVGTIIGGLLAGHRKAKTGARSDA